MSTPAEKVTEALPVATKIERYSINLMWINRTLKKQEYIYPCKDAHELRRCFFDPALKWATANPTAEINIWYDSVHTTKEAVKRTEEVLSSLCALEPKNRNIKFKNIWGIPIVHENPDIFSDQLPLYFRVDLLKAIIIVYEIERGGKDEAIFSDLEVGDLRPNRDRMSKEELFNDSLRLANAGLILNTSRTCIENQFLQLTNDPKMLLAIKHAIINVNLMRAVSALNFKGEEREDFLCSIGKAVYPSTNADVFKYYKAITTAEYQLKVRPDIVHEGSKTDPWVPYIPEKHGYAPFGLYYTSRMGVLGVDNKGEYYTPYDVMNLPNDAHVPSRAAHVVGGISHTTFPSDLVPRPPAVGDVYKCTLWDKAFDAKSIPLVDGHSSFSSSAEADIPTHEGPDVKLREEHERIKSIETLLKLSARVHALRSLQPPANDTSKGFVPQLDGGRVGNPQRIPANMLLHLHQPSVRNTK